MLTGLSFGIFAQNNSLDIGIFNYPKNSDKLEIRLKPNQNITNADYTGGIFTIRFPTASGAKLTDVVNLYGFGISKATPHTDGFTYLTCSYVAGGNVNKLNWQAGQEYIILTLQTNALQAKTPFELVTSQQWNEKNGGNYYQELNADAAVGAQKGIYQAATTVEVITAQVDLEENLKRSVYPNPSTTEFVVEINSSRTLSGNVFIELFDISGKQVFSETAALSGRKWVYQLPIQNLAAGKYILRYKNGKDIWQQKITKQ